MDYCKILSKVIKRVKHIEYDKQILKSSDKQKPHGDYKY
jgi:hypothetical protein